MGGYDATAGARFKTVREAMGVSYEEMAKVLRCERLYIRALEGGNALFSDELAEDLRDRFGINEAWLRGEDAPMFVEKDVKPQEPTGSNNIVQLMLYGALQDYQSLLENGDLQEGEATQSRRSYERAFDDCVMDHIDDVSDAAVDITLAAANLQGAAELEFFEHGMRYGARLVFNLLSGGRGLRCSARNRAGFPVSTRWRDGCVLGCCRSKRDRMVCTAVHRGERGRRGIIRASERAGRKRATRAFTGLWRGLWKRS